jgi:hypothetical protein
MATTTEIKLLRAIVSSGQASGINWEPVAAELGCNKKAAAERWRSFKVKLPLPADKEVTDSQAKLLLAVVPSAQVSGVSWEIVGKDLGCNKKAAMERWRAFRVKREKVGQSFSTSEGAVVNGEKAAVRATNGGVKKSSKKRKVEDSEGDSITEAVSEGGSVGGGINGSAKKRARVESEEKAASENVKEESDVQSGHEGNGLELDHDEFEVQHGGSGVGGFEGESGNEHCII